MLPPFREGCGAQPRILKTHSPRPAGFARRPRGMSFWVAGSELRLAADHPSREASGIRKGC
ncbi:MAG: hypothetical protein RI973_1275 [Bacteroidota bacterium]|jgi:hypothetical protein